MTIPSLLPPPLQTDFSYNVLSVTDSPWSVVTSILPISESRPIVSTRARSLAAAAPACESVGGAVSGSFSFLAIVSLDFLTLEADARRFVGGGGGDAAAAGLLRSSTIIPNVFFLSVLNTEVDLMNLLVHLVDML